MLEKKSNSTKWHWICDTPEKIRAVLGRLTRQICVSVYVRASALHEIWATEFRILTITTQFDLWNRHERFPMCHRIYLEQMRIACRHTQLEYIHGGFTMDTMGIWAWSSPIRRRHTIWVSIGLGGLFVDQQGERMATVCEQLNPFMLLPNATEWKWSTALVCTG